MACADCALSFPELTPQSFSFNSPQGMCVDCNGLGTRVEIDPELVVPDDVALARRGRGQAVGPGRLEEDPAGRTASAARSARSSASTSQRPWRRLPKRQRELAAARHRRAPLQGQVGRQVGPRHLRDDVGGRAAAPDAPLQGDQLRGREALVRAVPRRCALLAPARARACAPRAPRCAWAGARSSRSRRSPSTTARAFFGGARARRAPRARSRPSCCKEIRGRLDFLAAVGLGYLSLDRAGPVALGRRVAAHPAREPGRLGAHRRDLHPRRALDRPAPARQPPAARDARAHARHRQHRRRRRARRGDDPQRRPRDRLRPRRGRRGRSHRARGHAREPRALRDVAHRRLPRGPPRDPGARSGAGTPPAASRSLGARENNLRTSTSSSRSACWSR